MFSRSQGEAMSKHFAFLDNLLTPQYEQTEDMGQLGIDLFMQQRNDRSHGEVRSVVTAFIHADVGDVAEDKEPSQELK